MGDSVLVYKGKELASYGFGDPHPFGFDRHDVVRLTVFFASSGALDNLTFDGMPEPAPTAVFVNNSGQSLTLGSLGACCDGSDDTCVESVVQPK